MRTGAAACALCYQGLCARRCAQPGAPAQFAGSPRHPLPFSSPPCTRAGDHRGRGLRRPRVRVRAVQDRARRQDCDHRAERVPRRRRVAGRPAVQRHGHPQARPGAGTGASQDGTSGAPPGLVREGLCRGAPHHPLGATRASTEHPAASTLLVSPHPATPRGPPATPAPPPLSSRTAACAPLAPPLAPPLPPGHPG